MNQKIIPTLNFQQLLNGVLMHNIFYMFELVIPHSQPEIWNIFSTEGKVFAIHNEIRFQCHSLLIIGIKMVGIIHHHPLPMLVKNINMRKDKCANTKRESTFFQLSRNVGHIIANVLGSIKVTHSIRKRFLMISWPNLASFDT